MLLANPVSGRQCCKPGCSGSGQRDVHQPVVDLSQVDRRGGRKVLQMNLCQPDVPGLSELEGAGVL